MILFPLAFSNAPPVTEKIKKLTIFIFVSVTSFLALLTCINYIVHYVEFNLLIQQSKPIEIIGNTNHIYFSVMLALSIFLGLHLLNKEMKIIITTMADKLLLGAIIINIIALHILSARTGLMAFYAALIILLIRHTIISRRFRTLIGGLCAITIFPILMYLIVPSVKNRVNNTYNDLNRYFSGDYVGYYSISERFETWKEAYKIFLDHKVFGVGYGDLDHFLKVQQKIDYNFSKRDEALPNCHNQYIEILAAHGIIGIVVFLAMIITILKLVKQLPRNNYLILAFATIFIFSFMVESLLERQAGISLFLFFLFIIYNNAYDSLKNTSVAPNPNSVVGAS